MNYKNSALLYVIAGIIIIIGVLSTTIIMVFNDVNIITQPLPPSISLALILPIGIYYIVAIKKLEKMKRNKLYEEN